MADADPRIIVALDFREERRALDLAGRLTPAECRLKVGKEMFTRCGPALVRKLAGMGFGVFLDLKFHDIPNTVARAVEAAADLGVWMVNVHASGGPVMLEAAANALKNFGPGRPLLTAVTVLTSMDAAQLASAGADPDVERQALRLATLAARCGLDGAVCSAREAPALRRELGPGFRLVTPGIRPAASDRGDQIRTVTPEEAVRLGSDYLVIGRPVTAAPDPAAALRAIAASIAGL